MATFLFDLPSAEVENGTESNDVFISSNNNFGAGDQAFGNGGIDDFQYFADSSLTGTANAPNVFGGPPVLSKTYAAFILNSVETFTTVNDSGAQLIFDMSSSSGITDLVVANSTSGVVYDELNSLANIRLFDQTNAANANVAVGYDATLTATANTSVNLVMQATGGNIVRIGTATGTVGQPTNTGVETVRVSVLSGNSTIQTLDNASLTTLIFDDAPGAFSATIANVLSGTIRTVTNLSDGGATVNASAATAAVTFSGVGGDENFTGSAFDDTYTLGDGNNTVTTSGGNDNVTTGTGNDLLITSGVATVTSNLGGGNDTIQIIGAAVINNAQLGDGSDAVNATTGFFSAAAGVNDVVNFGTGFDVLFLAQTLTDAQLLNATNLEGIAVTTATTTTVGANAQANGLNTIFLGSGSAGNDIVNAGTFTTGLTIQAFSSDSASGAALNTLAGRVARFSTPAAGGGGDDTVTTGSAVDYFLFRGDNALTAADNLNAGLQSNAGGAVVGDTLVLEGDTTLAAGGGFTGFEFVALESAVGSLNRVQPTTNAAANVFGNTYNLTLTNANAPSAGQTLFINGSALRGAALNVNATENANINVSAITAFAVDITTGGGNDLITLGGGTTFLTRVVTQGGNDTVNETAGNTTNDVIDTGVGNDTVLLIGGNNTVFDQGSVGEFNVITLGTGNDSTFTGVGNDYIVAGTNLTGADNIADGGGATGFDTIQINAPTADANFAGVNAGGWERLVVTGGNVYVLGSNANNAGFIVIQDDNFGNTIDLTTGTFFDRAMQVDLRAGGNDTVLLGDVAPIAGLSVNNAAPPAPSTFDFVGPTVVNSVFPVTTFNPGTTSADRTGNANLVLGGLGSQTITGGAGTDVYRVAGTVVLDGTDVFNGGAGYDAIQFDNSGATFIGTVNLTNVTNVELFQILASGDTGPGVDFNGNIVTFTSTAGNVVNTLTRLVLDNSQLNDVNAVTGASNDSTTFVIANSVVDPDFAFTVFGGASTTILDKQNNGTNNNVNFQGGSGADLFRVSGNDLGGSTIFNGQGGIDQIILTAGAVTDDSYDNVTNVEILTAVGIALNATLGAQAGASGLNRIIGTNINTDTVLLDAAFNAPTLRYDANGGFDNFNATNSPTTITFYETLGNIDTNDTFIGGANGADRFVIDATATSTGNLTRVDGVETFDVTSVNGNNLTLTLGQFVNPTTGLTTSTIGAGAQTFNFLVNGVGSYAVTISGGTENANTVVNLRNTTGADRVTLGSGNDTVYGGGGADEVWGGAGTDTIFGDAGNDRLKGEAGADTIDGGDGDDFIGGGASATAGTFDTLIGGIGNDVIYGGAGSDVILGGAGNDQYIYRTASASESAFGARDTVTVGTGDVFVFDGSDPDGAGPLVATAFDVAYVGSTNNFQDAQSSTIAGDGILQAVFQADQNLLWVDINDDGALNNNDLQINILLEPGVTLTAAMFTNNDAAVANFDAAFVGPF